MMSRRRHAESIVAWRISPVGRLSRGPCDSGAKLRLLPAQIALLWDWRRCWVRHAGSLPGLTTCSAAFYTTAIPETLCLDKAPGPERGSRVRRRLKPGGCAPPGRRHTPEVAHPGRAPRPGRTAPKRPPRSPQRRRRPTLDASTTGVPVPHPQVGPVVGLDDWALILLTVISACDCREFSGRSTPRATA